MKSFTFTTLAALLLSAAQAESIQSEAAAAIDSQLEHKHVSISSYENKQTPGSAVHNPMNAIIQRNAAICAKNNNYKALMIKLRLHDLNKSS